MGISPHIPISLSDVQHFSRAKGLYRCPDMERRDRMSDPTEWFNTVYERTYAALRQSAIIKARAVSDVDDLLQNTYTRFYRHICRYGTASVREPNGYLMTVLKREIATYYRTHKPSVQLPEEPPLPDAHATEAIGLQRVTVGITLQRKLFRQ